MLGAPHHSTAGRAKLGRRARPGRELLVPNDVRVVLASRRTRSAPAETEAVVLG
jgi:hypothetical protein